MTYGCLQNAKLNDLFLDKTSLAKNFKMNFRGGSGGWEWGVGVGGGSGGWGELQNFITDFENSVIRNTGKKREENHYLF